MNNSKPEVNNLKTNDTVFRLLKESLFEELNTPDEHPATLLESGLLRKHAGKTDMFDKDDTDCDWETVYQEMQDQAIAALPYYHFQKKPVPDALLQEKWRRFCIRQQGRWLRIMHAQSQLVNLMEDHKIPCVIIKGAAAAIAYPYPTLRSAGDVDFLVRRSDYERAARLLEESGFCLSHDKRDTGYHYTYKKYRVSFELHKRLGIVGASNEELLSLFEKGIENRVWESIEGISFPMLPADMNGLVLLFHIDQHLRSGVGLRHIADWMMYLQKNKNLEQLLPVFRRTGTEKLALTVTLLCCKYLGFEYALQETVLQQYDTYPCDELMQYVMSKGNFGKKSGDEGKVSSVFLDATGPFRVFQRLQKGGLLRWKAAGEHKMLQPFAWVYQTGRIIGEISRNRVIPRKMVELREEGIKHRELIRSLGLEIDREIR